MLAKKELDESMGNSLIQYTVDWQILLNEIKPYMASLCSIVFIYIRIKSILHVYRMYLEA